MRSSASPVKVPAWVYVAGVLFVVVMGYVVFSSFQRPDLPSFPPSEPGIRTGTGTVVHDTFTIDARAGDRWVFFDFSRGTTVVDPPPTEWDLAARRYTLVVNGGPEFEGGASVASIDGDTAGNTRVPSTGYRTTTGSLDGEPETPGLTRWYRYSFVAHTLEPLERTYVLRTTEGHYARFRVLGYYCPGAVPGCLTIEYTYRRDGSPDLRDKAPAPAPASEDEL